MHMYMYVHLYSMSNECMVFVKGVSNMHMIRMFFPLYSSAGVSCGTCDADQGYGITMDLSYCFNDCFWFVGVILFIVVCKLYAF